MRSICREEHDFEPTVVVRGYDASAVGRLLRDAAQREWLEVMLLGAAARVFSSHRSLGKQADGERRRASAT